MSLDRTKGNEPLNGPSGRGNDPKRSKLAYKRWAIGIGICAAVVIFLIWANSNQWPF